MCKPAENEYNHVSDGEDEDVLPSEAPPNSPDLTRGHGYYVPSTSPFSSGHLQPIPSHALVPVLELDDGE